MKNLSRTTLVVIACGTALFTLMASAGDGPATTSPLPAVTALLPRLVDLGASRCIPCKMMVPILDGLKKEYEGRMQVDFIDVWQNPDAGKQYAVKMIPTQIFFDAKGQEIYRHEGFFAKEDILAKWKQLGVDLREKKGSQ